MDQKVKIECKHQSQNIYQNQLGMVSQSQPKGRNTRKAKNPRNKINKQTHRLQFQKNNWLINLVKLNPFKMTQIMASISNLVDIVNEVETKQLAQITNLNFDKIRKNQQIYHIFIHYIDNTFYSIKIRDNSGYIVSFKIRDSENMVNDLGTLFKRMGDKMPIYIYQYTPNISYIQQIHSNYHGNNLIFLLKQPLKISTLTCYKNQQGLIFHFHHKMKKVIPFAKIIQQFASVQNQEKNKIRQILTSYQQDLNDDTHSLIANILCTSKGICKNKIGQILRNGLNVLNQHINRWAQNDKKHYPGQGTSQNKECFWCKRKRSQAVCKGCSLIYQRQVRLCIRNCFQKHHESNRMFIQTQKDQICKNISFFDGRCNQIGQLMQHLSQQENPQFLQFITYLRTRMIGSFNRLTNCYNEDQYQQND